MSSLLAAASAKYDLVLIDTAPAIVAGDGLALSQRCDATLLVVRAFGEKRGLVARIRNELSESRGEFLGVLVNSVRASAGGYLRGNFRATQEYHQP
jgi:Mrp family chromosome partitioning ATPase